MLVACSRSAVQSPRDRRDASVSLLRTRNRRLEKLKVEDTAIDLTKPNKNVRPLFSFGILQKNDGHVTLLDWRFPDRSSDGLAVTCHSASKTDVIKGLLSGSNCWHRSAVDNVLASSDGRRSLRSEECDQFGNFLRTVWSA
jgi:hypothetical protein